MGQIVAAVTGGEGLGLVLKNQDAWLVPAAEPDAARDAPSSTPGENAKNCSRLHPRLEGQLSPSFSPQSHLHISI